MLFTKAMEFLNEIDKFNKIQKMNTKTEQQTGVLAIVGLDG